MIRFTADASDPKSNTDVDIQTGNLFFSFPDRFKQLSKYVLYSQYGGVFFFLLCEVMNPIQWFVFLYFSFISLINKMFL